MDSHRHGIIHDVVFVSDWVEDLINKRLLRLSGDILESEMIIWGFGLIGE